MPDDIIVRVVSLPIRVNAVTVPDEDGIFNIYINDRLATSEQHRALRHEVMHIKGKHFYSLDSVDLCEKFAKEHSR